MEERGLRVGVDSGGTFTDICVFDETSGDVFVWKVPSTPADPSEGIANGASESLRLLRESGNNQAVSYFGHGTTVATNALIQKRGANTGLITTEGYRDLLEIRRQQRPYLYDIQGDLAPALVSRDKRVEVSERLNADGTVETALDEESVRAALRSLKGKGVEAVAICLLFSFVSPAHEQRIRAIAAEELPDAFISASHTVAPEIGEFERLSTVVMNSYLGPIIRGYVEKLQPKLAAAGIDATPHLTQSNGGVISAETACQFPVRTLLSGPAAGVTGAASLAGLSGFSNVITFDMGGTSTDVALIEDGKLQYSGSQYVHGYPLKIGMLDIHTVGAGGGSIAYIDDGGVMKVGPRSAGAYPGPVCYDQGNEEATVTDANVVLRVLNPEYLLGGRMKIDSTKAEAAVSRLAEKLGMSVLDTAQGIITIVTANMVKAIRVISVERGYDPREFTLVAFGGAGPIHACRLARALEIGQVMVPRSPGILCAMGLLLTDLRTNISITRMMPVASEAVGLLEAGFAEAEASAGAWFAAEGIVEESRQIIRSVDIRYKGQGYELTIPYPENMPAEQLMPEFRRLFDEAHRQLYGYAADPREVAQIRTLRVEAIGKVRKAELKAYPPATGKAGDAILSVRNVFLPESGDYVAVPVYDRDRLEPGHAVSGPAIIDQMDSTTLVLPGQTARVDPYLNLLIQG